MANFIQGTQLRTMNRGNLVTKAAANLPQSATGTLFTVAGGLVLVTGFLGVVTTVFQGTDPVLSLGTAPTSGTAATNSLATTVDTSSTEVGTMMTVQASGGLGGALVVHATPAKAGHNVFLSNEFLVNTGTVTWTTGASKTGAMKWYLTYIPLDDGASVS